jgi:hypothetical protein
MAAAVAVSALAHAAVVVFGRMEPPREPEEPLPLAVRIAPEPPPPAAPAVATPRPEKRRPQRTAAARVTPVAPAPAIVYDAATVTTDVAQEPAEAPAETATADAAPPDAPKSEPIVVATAPPSTLPEAPSIRPLPRKGRITYDLVYGRDGFPVGRTVQTWEMDGAGYRLASRSETTGIVDLFRSQHRTYFSRGSVTREGLRPETFLMSRDRGRGTEEARAKFDWSSATVTLGGAADVRDEPLPARSQDILSFIYQLALDPPARGRLRQVVTNGSRIEAYDLDVLAEEIIDTPIGALRTLPVKQLRKGRQETIELWLAVEYRYLPVRLRFFNRDGEPQGEQIVTEIRLSDE